MLAYLLLYLLFVCFLQCHAINDHDGSLECNFLDYVNSDVSLELKKSGFHRELMTSVRFNKHGLLDKALLVYTWPKDIYVDPYQLASMKDQRNWEILLGSTIDLETPAHKSPGFRTYLYLHLEESTTGQINLMIPIHGRYQKPSFKGNDFISVIIPPPDLLLRTVQNCTQLTNRKSFSLVEAPCTANNSSTCQWIKIHHHQQLPDPVTLQLPVGDASQIIPVCGGTLVLTIICCAALSILAWTHRLM